MPLERAVLGIRDQGSPSTIGPLSKKGMVRAGSQFSKPWDECGQGIAELVGARRRAGQDGVAKLDGWLVGMSDDIVTNPDRRLVNASRRRNEEDVLRSGTVGTASPFCVAQATPIHAEVASPPDGPLDESHEAPNKLWIDGSASEMPSRLEPPHGADWTLELHVGNRREVGDVAHVQGRLTFSNQ
jgi:hypothetical protein